MITRKDKFETVMDGIFAAATRFMWFVAGTFFGYLWMANAFGLI